MSAWLGLSRLAAVLAPFAQEHSAPTPLFRDVAPLLDQGCVGCHRTGGSAPFALDSAEEASKRARMIALVTRQRSMPPWKPAPGPLAFTDERRLTGEEIELFARWAEAGAPLGGETGRSSSASRAPREASARRSPWVLGEPDRLVEIDEPFVVPAEGRDAWKSFVIALENDEPLYVEALEFWTDNAQGLHHLISYTDATPAVRQALEDTDGISEIAASVGFSNMAELSVWLPGVSPWRLPDGAAWTFPPGTHLVLDTHFRPRGRPVPTIVRAALHLRDGPPTTPMTMVRLAADQAINLPPGNPSVTYTDAFELPVPVRLERIMPHAHYLCREVRVRAVPPGGEPLELIHIPDWDFQWHDFYGYADPPELSAGTRIEMTFTFDNSAENPANPWDPPRRVIGGAGSVEEMALVALLFTTGDEAQRAVLAEAAQAHVRELKEVTLLLSRCLHALVRRFDTDGDDALDEGEERAACAFLETIEERPEAARYVFDRDKDGEISEEERALVHDVCRRWRGEVAETISASAR
jgi:hypothetical protein